MSEPPFPHEPEDHLGGRVFTRRVSALGGWCYLLWLLLAATLSVTQLLFGLVVSVAVGCVLAPFGEVPGPWRLVSRRAIAVITARLRPAPRGRHRQSVAGVHETHLPAERQHALLGADREP